MSKRRAELHLHQYLSPSLLGHLPRDGHLHDRGKGESEAGKGEGGIGFLLQIPGGRGGVSRTGGAKGPGGSAANWGILGGAQIFLFVAKMSTK